jgi:hypothetical protein
MSGSSGRSLVGICVLAVSITLLSCTEHHMMVKNRPAQFLSGNENVLLLAPKELLGAAVRVDGRLAGYLWEARDIRDTGVDQLYKPAFPADAASDICATRLYVPNEDTHELVIHAIHFAAVRKKIDVSTPRPLLLRISRDEVVVSHD